MSSSNSDATPTAGTSRLPPPMPLLSISSPETIKKCALMPLRDSDIFITSYPKSGTTWLQHIVLSLLLASSPTSIPPYDHVSDYAPFFEIDPHWQEDELAPWIRQNHAKIGRRVFNTHLRFDMLPTATAAGGGASSSVTKDGAKFICIVRSPLDTCVSFFHHLSNQVQGGFEGDFDTFFSDWCDGNIAFGSWSDHILSYVNAFACGVSERVTLQDGRQFLLLSYEDMIADLPHAVETIVDFLQLSVSPQQQAELLPTFSFSSMKADIARFQPKSVQWKNHFSFLRKGAIGDAKTIVSVAQRDAFAQRLEQQAFENAITAKLWEANSQVYTKIRSLLD